MIYSYNAGNIGKGHYKCIQHVIINDYFADLMSRSSLQGSSVALLPEDNEDSRTAALMR